MAKKTGFSSKVWLIMMIISSLFIVLTIFILCNGANVLARGLELAGSSMLIENVEEKALGFINMSMYKPLWEEIWLGIFGIVFAIGLRRGMKYAHTLGIIWGLMLVINAIIQGAYEIIILKWSNACLQTYVFLVLGIIPLISLLITRKKFISNPD
ncbi:MAG: hypothetical protein JSV22_12275 [Bacteroidales bacterium]|nr:MAG: hypothetical protein JSV22_12275 [Bacteroidales bacterium]